MFIQRGDTVRTACYIGEVIDTWGVTQMFIRIRLADNRIIPLFAKEVLEVINVKPDTASSKRTRRSKKNGMD